MAANLDSSGEDTKPIFQPLEDLDGWEQAFIEALSAEEGRAAYAHLREGRAVFLSDPQYPGQIIRLYPNGRREIVTIDDRNQIAVVADLG